MSNFFLTLRTFACLFAITLTCNALADDNSPSQQFTVVMEQPGTLEEVLGDKPLNITSLKIVGNIYSSDLLYLAPFMYSQKFLSHYFPGNDAPDKKLAWHKDNNTNTLNEIDLSEATLLMSNNEEQNQYRYYEKLPPVNNPTMLVHYATIDDINSLPRNIFENCENLKKMHLPNYMHSTGYGSFANSGLTEIPLTASIDTISNWSFEGTYATHITFPNSVKYIGAGAFYHSRLEEIHLPNSLSYLGSSAFSFSIHLKSINIPEKIDSIYKETFRGCDSLSTIYIPKNIKYIGDGAFKIDYGKRVNRTIHVYGCPDLEGSPFCSSSSHTNIYFYSATPCKLKNVYLNEELYIPIDAKDAYLSNPEWKKLEKRLHYFDATVGVATPSTPGKAHECDIYSINGQRLKNKQKGINIIRMSDGSVKKVIVR